MQSFGLLHFKLHSAEFNVAERKVTDTFSLTLQECLKFLKDIHFGGSQNLSGNSFHQSGSVLNLYVETAATFLKVLLETFGFSAYLCLIRF